MNVETVDSTLAAVGSKVTYTGAGLTGLGWFASSEFMGLAGLAIGVVGMVINWYYKAKADRRLDREHALRMERMDRGLFTDSAESASASGDE